MHNITKLPSAILIAVLAWAQPAAASAQASQVTNGDVIKMVQAGIGEELIVQSIRTAPSTQFDLAPPSIIALKHAGVSDVVLAVMLKAPPIAVTANRPDVVKTLMIPDGTELHLRLLTPMSSATARNEDPVRLEVIEDVVVRSATVIRKGAEAKGHVSDAKKNGSFGRSGKLTFSIDSVIAVDGSPIGIRSSRELKGDARVGATVAAVALVGVFGGFVKGKNIEAPAGGEYTVFTDGARDVRIDPAPR